jgi:hypothetical protein
VPPGSLLALRLLLLPQRLLPTQHLLSLHQLLEQALPLCWRGRCNALVQHPPLLVLIGDRSKRLLMRGIVEGHRPHWPTLLLQG